MRCLRHKIEGAIHSQGHVSDWPAQLPKTVLLVGIRESPVWKGKQSGERLSLFADLGDFCVFLFACGWSSIFLPHLLGDGPEQALAWGNKEVSQWLAAFCCMSLHIVDDTMCQDGTVVSRTYLDYSIWKDTVTETPSSPESFLVKWSTVIFPMR